MAAPTSANVIELACCSSADSVWYDGLAVRIASSLGWEAVARLATGLGYRTELVHDEEDDAWTCYCTKAMVATYDGIVEAQRELDELSRPFGGHSDGWGTSGDSADG